MLERDVNNVRAAFARAAPELLQTAYAQEIWKLYQASALTPETPLTGRSAQRLAEANLGAVLDQIEDARREAAARQRGREETQSV
jgi:RIO kinase 1